MRPHLPVSPCQPQSSGRSCSIGCESGATWPISRPGWATPCTAGAFWPRVGRSGAVTPPSCQDGPDGTARGRQRRRVGEDEPVVQLREVTVLGSTGSIGRQAIAVARQNPDRLRITALAAGGGDVGLLAEQALTLGVRTVAVRSEEHTSELQSRQYLVCRLLLEKKKPK